MEYPNKKIAIVGAGIIGLYLAEQLSKQGHLVSVFEKKSENKAGYKVCSGLYSERILKYIPLAQDCIENKIKSCIIQFSKKQVKLNFQPQHLVINRERLVKHLICLARQAGAKLYFEQEIKDIPIGFDYVIGCDGAGSVIRKLLNLSSPRISLGAQIFIEKSDNSNFVLSQPISSGFCWKIPRGEQVEYGVMGSPRKAEKEFINFLKKINLDYSGKLFSAAIPQPKFLGRDAGLIFPKRKNITLCGDASGLTKPWSGGGIIWGLTAADILLKTFPNFLEYKKQTIKRFRGLILKGQISKQLVFFAGQYLPFVLPTEMVYDNDFPNFLPTL